MLIMLVIINQNKLSLIMLNLQQIQPSYNIKLSYYLQIRTLQRFILTYLTIQNKMKGNNSVLKTLLVLAACLNITVISLTDYHLMQLQKDDDNIDYPLQKQDKKAQSPSQEYNSQFYYFRTYEPNRTKLFNQLGTYFGVNYLGRDNNSNFQSKKQGIIWGYQMENFVNLPVKLSYPNCSIIINVFFKICTGSSMTTLRTQVIDKLYDECSITRKQQYLEDQTVYINHRKANVRINSGLQDLNILGGQFMRLNKIKLHSTYSYFQAQLLTLTFNASNDHKQEL